MNEFYLRFIELPYKVKGVTTLNDDGTYNIYINSIISDYEKEKAFKHEIKHIEADDFYSSLPAHIIERNRK